MRVRITEVWEYEIPDDPHHPGYPTGCDSTEQRMTYDQEWVKDSGVMIEELGAELVSETWETV